LVTEIPEHLLRRSKERRAALSGEGGAEATEQAAATVAETPRASPPVPAGSATPETQAGAGGGGPATGVPAVAATPAPAPRIGPTRPGVPIWIMPVLVALPLWGIIYLGAFGSRAKANSSDPVTVGGSLFLANCSSCHGAGGDGGVGPALSGGEVLRVWPKVADHVKWVQTGGAPYVGKTIGVNQKIPVPANNVMPAFSQANGGTLTDAQIAQVVCYERVAFGGEKESVANCPGFTG
jgi:mono/diheme cytochrome c family protein